MNLENYINNPIEIKDELLSFYSNSDSIIIFDIGSCELEDSIRYSNLFPNSKIYSFEPFLENFEKGLKNIEKYHKENIFSFNEALSNKVGESTFYLSSGHPLYISNSSEWNYGNKSSSLIKPNKHEWLVFNKNISVKTNTIFNFCKTKSINYINFVHIDVQGAELMVLEGAFSFINNIDIIWIEVSLVEFYKGQPLKHDIISFLEKNNFIIIKDTCDYISGDLLCINKKNI